METVTNVMVNVSVARMSEEPVVTGLFIYR